MEVIDFLGKGLKFPISIKKESLCTADGEQSIKDSVILILGTAKGERVMCPNFGCKLNELVFAPNNRSTSTLIKNYIEEALLNWEPRIDIESINVTPKADEPVLQISIDYLINSSNTKANLVYPFYLESVGK